MYENSSDFQSKPTTLPMYPRHPDADDPRWRDVAVRARSQSQTNVNRFPVEAPGMHIATVYSGDSISIMPEVQYEYYVAARIGYHVGWINFKHVKLVSLHRGGRVLEETKPDAPEDRDERIAERQAELRQRAYVEESQQAQYHEPHFEKPQYKRAEYAEQETQPAPILAQRKPPPIERSDLHRIINKLKNLGSFLSRR